MKTRWWLDSRYRPVDTLRITSDFEFGYNDASFTRTSPRQVQVYKVHAAYTPRPWLSLDGAIDIHENRDNVYQVNDLEHGRTYSFVTILSPNPKVTLDIGYNYNDIYSQADVCFAYSTVPATSATLRRLPDRRFAGSTWRPGFLQQQGTLRSCGGNVEAYPTRYGGRGIRRNVCWRQYADHQSAPASRITGV